MNWKTIGLKTSLQISFEMCERVELNNDPCGDGSDEFVYYGESLTGNGWGDAFAGEVGDGEGFGFLLDHDVDLNSFSEGEGWGDASYFITGEVGSSHSGDGISSS